MYDEMACGGWIRRRLRPYQCVTIVYRAHTISGDVLEVVAEPEVYTFQADTVPGEVFQLLSGLRCGERLELLATDIPGRELIARPCQPTYTGAVQRSEHVDCMT